MDLPIGVASTTPAQKTCTTQLLAALNARSTYYSGTITPIRYHDAQASSRSSFGTGAIPTGLPFGVATKRHEDPSSKDVQEVGRRLERNKLHRLIRHHHSHSIQ
jgi:hypothetical protein